MFRIATFFIQCFKKKHSFVENIWVQSACGSARDLFATNLFEQLLLKSVELWLYMLFCNNM